MKTSDILESLGYDKYGTRKKDKDSKDVGLPANKDTAKRDTSVFESLGYNPDGTKKGSENAERTTFQTVPEIVIPRRTQSVTDAQSSLTARKNYAEKIKTGSIAPVQPIAQRKDPVQINALGAGERPYDTGRGDKTLFAALEGVGSGYSGALATLMDAAESVEKKLRTAKDADLPATHLEEERGFLGLNLTPEEEQSQNEEAIRQMRGISDRLGVRSQAHQEQAKSGLGTIGSVAVDLGLTGTQMLTDAGAAALTGGGSALVPMAMRVFGQGSQEAYRSGASIGKQIGYGAASAAVEVLTEKMWGGLAGLYGKGFGDDFVKGAVKEVTEKITSRPAGQALLMLLADMGGEGMEEVLSGLVTPLIQSIYNGKTMQQSWKEGFDPSETLYEGLIGALLGGIGGTVELPGNLSDARTVAAGKAIDEFYNTAANYGLYSEEARISLANAEDKLARSDGRRISIRPQVIRPDEREATGDPLYDAALSAERAQQQPIEQIEQETPKSAEDAIRAAAEKAAAQSKADESEETPEQIVTADVKPAEEKPAEETIIKLVMEAAAKAAEIEQEKAKPVDDTLEGQIEKAPANTVATGEKATIAKDNGNIYDIANQSVADAYANEISAQLSSTDRYVDRSVEGQGIVYRITGNDKEGYIAAIYREGYDGSIANARDSIYTMRGFATRQDAADDLVGVSRRLAPKEGLSEATASDNINLQDVVDNGTLPEQGASAQTGNVLGGTQSANTAKESADNGSERVDEGRGTVRGGSSGGRTGAVSETNEVAAQSGDSKRSGNSGEIRVRDDGEKGSGDGGRINGLLGGNGSGKGLLTGSNAGGDGTADGKDHAGLSEKASVEKPSKKKLNKQNYRIVEDIDSKRPNYNDNLEAIKLVKRLEADGRKATAEERAILARYKGWGGLKQDILGWKSRELKQYLTNDEYEAAKASILNAHYTSTKIIAGMYKAISRMGFTGGNVLEPSMGVGNFFGMMPNSLASASTLYGVELDNITGLIAKHLYPDAEIHVAGFQDVLYPDDTFDLVVGNVPFSNDIKIPYRGTSFNLHDFFFVKSLDEMKSGGVAALITSTGTLDKISGKTQSAIAKRANLIAAFRLPDNAFSTNAGTSVTTDLIFLQKKGGGIEDNGVEFTHIGDINGIPINEYYAQHPKNILGELAYEKNMYQSERVVVHAMDSFENSFNKAINSLPKGIMSADGSQPSVVKVKHRGDKGKKTFTVTSEGAAIVDTDGNAEKISDKNASIVKGFIEVKQAYFSVIDAERAGNLTAADEYRKRLNTVYDAFAKKHGSISSNKRLLKQDDDFTRVSGLEVIQDKGAATKSAIFSMPTVSKAKKTSADTSEEALSITLNEDGNVDIERISQLTGKSRDTVLDELKDEVIFTPDGEYVLMAKYLSGNIYEKLAAVKGKNGFEKHEALLRATIPTPKQAKDITAEFGSHWIPEKYIAEFVSSAFKSYGRVVVEYSKELGTWEVSKFGTQSTKYSTDRVSAPDIVKNTLNGKNIAVYDTIDEHRVLNKKATEAAQQKQNDLRQDFSKWIFEDDTRRADLERIFNETLNAYAPMQYKGLSDRINFGISPKSKIKLRSYQKEGVARIVYGGNTLLHHGVGTGKTATMIAAAHVLKQTGIANKPMFVVPNGKVNDFRNEILDMYPYANVLALDDKSMTPAELQRTKSMIATGDYDYIIIYRTAFQKIAVSPETEAAFIQAQLDDLERAIRESGASKNGSTMFEKNLIARKKTLEEKLKAVLDKPKDNTINFEDTGIDALFIDEAHNFKKVGFATTHNVSGIDSSTNNMTTDLYMKENYLRNRGARIVLATATPLTNTLSEMYNMTMHVNPDVLRDVGIYSFDGWLNTFADIQSQPEIAPDGKTWRMKERVRGFKSGNEMVGLYRQFADVKQTKDVVKELPKAKYVDVVCKGTDIHQALLDSFADRSAKKDPKDNMLVISNDGRAAGADLRLLTGVLQETYPGITETELDLQESKINRSVGNILDEYHGSMKTNGTQFVFLDVGVHSGGGRYSFNLYTDLINKLVAAGIPRTEIANIQDYDGETKRTELYDAMNTGKIRVLIGSTAKMGEGVNAQNKAVALHHLSVPFRPDNLEQREGRIVRNGNENKNVTIYRYIQEKSFDSYLWQMIERKAAYVAQALNGGDASDLEENGEAIVNAREAKAIATGNPLIMEKFTLQDKVNRLKMLRSSFYDEQRRAAQKVASSESDIASVKKILAAAKKDAATVENNKTDELRIKIGNTIYDNRKKAGDALQKEQRVGKIGEVYGLNIYRATSDKVYLKGEQKYSDTELGDSSEGNITRILNATASPAQTVRWSTNSIKEKEASFEDAQEVLNRKFAKQDELDNAVARLFEVDTELGIIQNEVNFDEMAVSETEGGDNEVSNLISTDTSKQSIPSAKTSINSGKLPVLFSKVKFNSGTVNLDIGGGKFDNATEHLANQGIASYIYDPYNRTDEHNKMAAAATQDGQSDTVTISNVLNVIKEQDARNEVLQNAVDAVKQDGTVYITVYTGDGKGVGRISKTEDGTASCWQENRATVTYVKEVSKYFKNVTLKNGVIIAKSPNKALVGSDGNKQKAINNFASVSEAAEIWGGYRMRNDRADGKWSTGRVGDSDKKPLPISDIVSKIRHDFGIPIVTGHIRGQMILGQYNNRTGGIRTKIANDLPTVSHELGHRIDSLFGVTEELSQLMQDELTSSMSAALKRRYTNNELVSEGFAEFVRKYLQNRETASIDYPNFTAHFREAVDKESLDMIHTFADDINAYYSLDTETAQSSIRLRDEGPADFRTAGEKLADAGDMVYQAWVDSLHGIKLFDRATGANTYYRASNSAYADSMAYAILTKDLTDINGQKIGEGLTAALRGINTRNKKEYAAFGEYLAVKHGPERLAEGQRIFADDRKNSTVWMNNRQRQLENEYPEFAAASERLYEFERNFDTAWLVNTGLVSADTAKEWAERWDFYVPLNRSVGKKSLIGAKRGFANQNSTVKRARGSGLDIVNPVDSIINNIVLRVNAGTRNDVMRVITDAASTLDDTAKFIEKIPTPMKRTGFSMAGVKDQLMEGIIASGMSEKDTSEAIDIVQGLEDILYQYSRGTAHGNIITVLRDGEPEFWQVNDPMLLESITNLSPKEHHPIMEAYGRISRFMTGNITGRNVLWSIFSNAPRDLMTLFTYSKDKNVFKLFSGIASSYVQRAKGVKADAMYQEYISMGGGNTSAYTADKNLAKSIRKKLTPGKLSWLNPLEWLDYVSDMVEAGPRYSHYRLMRTNGMTPQEAFYASMDVTVNFRRGGSQSRAVNNFVPFFNAGIQGLDKFSRWVTAEDAPAEKRKAVVAKRMSAYIAASSILGTLMWFINSRDDDKKKEYAQLSNYTKNNFFCIPLGKGKYFTIPKPREIAVLSSFIETCIERYANDNPDAFDEFYDYATDMFMPSAISNLAQGDVYGSLGSLGVAGVASYMMANRDFLGKPIESNALRSLEPKDRYTNRTSKIAYWAGQAFNTSPTMIDYFFQQTLGGFWKAQKALFPVGSENIDYTLGVQGTYVRDNQYSTDLINRLYDGSEKAAQKSKSHSDDVKAAMTARQYDRMTAFYGRYSKLSKGVATTESTRSTRQTVLNMVNEFNKTMESGYRTEEQAALDKIIEQTGDPSLYPAVMSDQVKDYDGVKHPLTAEAYVEYQTNYNDLYWQYAEIAMNDSKIKDKAMGLEIARSKAADKALENALAKMSIHPPVKENIVPATSITVRDDIVYQAALKVANKNGGGLSGDEIEAAIDAMPWLDDEEKAYLYQSEYKGSVIGNPYATTDTLKEYIRGKLEDGAERSSITREVTSAYKPAIVSLYEAGEKRAMKEAIMKLQSLGLQDKDGDQYYSTDRIIGWIEKK